MGRASLYLGLIFALLGFVSGVYVFTLGPVTSLPPMLVLLMCPAAILGELIPTADVDSSFMWLCALINCVFYGAVGVFLGKLLHVDQK